MNSRSVFPLLCAVLFTAASAHAQSGYALSFNPFEADEVNVALPAPSGSMTLAAWVLSFADPEAYGFYTIMEFGHHSPFFGVIGNGIGVTETIYAGVPLARGTWQHVAYTYDGTHSRLYVNGEEVAMNDTPPPAGGAQLGIGYGIGGTAWPGYIDEVAIWRSARSAADIARDMSGLTPEDIADADLLAYFKFDEGTGQTTANAKAGGPHGVLGPSTEVEINDPTWIFVSHTPVAGGPERPPALRLSRVWPNPLSSRGTFSFEVDAPQHVQIAVYDVVGRRVAVLHEGQAVPDASLALSLDAAALSAGVYVIRAVSAGGTASQRVTVAR